MRASSARPALAESSAVAAKTSPRRQHRRAVRHPDGDERLGRERLHARTVAPMALCRDHRGHLEGGLEQRTPRLGRRIGCLRTSCLRNPLLLIEARRIRDRQRTARGGKGRDREGEQQRRESEGAGIHGRCPLSAAGA
jgi:hypothetical protein